MATVFIAIGSNLGDRVITIDEAIRQVGALPCTKVTRVSTYHETDPVGVTDQPMFLNAAAEIDTALEPADLLRELQQIELDLGRVRRQRWGPRTIDLDIVFYGDRVIDEPGLTVPHPRMAEREFVLAPLAEIAPDATHPTRKKTVSQLLAELKEKSG